MSSNSIMDMSNFQPLAVVGLLAALPTSTNVDETSLKEAVKQTIQKAVISVWVLQYHSLRCHNLLIKLKV